MPPEIEQRQLEKKALPKEHKHRKSKPKMPDGDLHSDEMIGWGRPFRKRTTDRPQSAKYVIALTNSGVLVDSYMRPLARTVRLISSSMPSRLFSSEKM